MKYSNLRRILFMRFFVDTANVEDIRKANDMGIICGVTTNPSLIAKEGRDFKEVSLRYIHRRRTDQRRGKSYHNRCRRHDQRRP